MKPTLLFLLLAFTLCATDLNRQDVIDFAAEPGVSFLKILNASGDELATIDVNTITLQSTVTVERPAWIEAYSGGYLMYRVSFEVVEPFTIGIEEQS